MKKANLEGKPELAKVQDLIAEVKIGMLVTNGPDGNHMYARPMQTQEMDEDGCLWFFSSDHTDKDYEIEKDAQVNVCYADNGNQTYVSVSGTAQTAHDREKMRELWSPIMKAWYPQGLDTPGISLLKVHIEKAAYWNDTDSRMVEMFRIAKAIIVGETYDGADHGKVENK